MLASSGEITPPCGVPSSVGLISFFCLRLAYPLQSTTPAFNQDLINRLMVGNVFNLCSSASWLMRSKHLAMSASSTYFGFLQMLACIATIPSWHERLNSARLSPASLVFKTVREVKLSDSLTETTRLQNRT